MAILAVLAVPRVVDVVPSSGKLLVVEDRDSLRRLMRRALMAQGHAVTAVATREEADTQLASQVYDLVFSDLRLPDGTGVDVLRALREREAEAGRAASPFVILTAFGDVSSAVEAMKLGASDFLEKPVEIDDLCELADRLLGADGAADAAESGGANELPASAVWSAAGAPKIIGAHPRLSAAIKLLQRVAPSEGTVLLLGESGTGKELFARALHALSRRAGGPFVALNCAAVPTALLESELFGHEKGAFTGAAARRIGRFEQAEGGTLFLDEIGELELGVQAKLLRVLEERSFERVGGSRTQSSDVRVVAATNVDLEGRVNSGSFRTDLYYRLEVFPIRIPPLSDRRSDVPLLALHLLQEASKRNGISVPRLSQDAATFLQQQSWPGNVRELANVMERAAVLCEGDEVDREQVQAAMLRAIGAAAGNAEGGGGAGAALERDRVKAALLAADGDKKAAARQLGLSYRTLQRRVVHFDLEGYPRYREAPDPEH